MGYQRADHDESYNTFLNLYENSYVESGSETKAFDADNIIYNAWVSLDITGLVIGNNNNQTFSVVLRDMIMRNGEMFLRYDIA